MLLTSAVLLAMAVLLAEPVARGFGSARWSERAPRAALALWQAIGLAAGLAAIGAGVVAALSPLADDLPHAMSELARNTFADGAPLRGLSAANVVVGVLAAALGLRLFGVLLASVVSTLRRRRTHRRLVELLASPWPDLGRVLVLDHPAAVAYCLPGLRSRVVVSAGALAVLNADEMAAVLAHEHAHLDARHDLVVLPFVAWGRSLPFLAGVAGAQVAVAQLVEMLADDRARAEVGAEALASALSKVGGHSAPEGSLAVAELAVLARLRRILQPEPPLPLSVRAAVYFAAAALVLAPTLALFAPALV
jgi:Zn-dependent protease with chaperone function